MLEHSALMLLVLLANAHAQPLTSECNCVIFRLDDVRDDWLVDQQIATMELFKNNSLTIGIIANLFGNDSRIAEYVRNNLGRLEIANHGWNHESFAQLSFEEQKELIAKANMKIQDTVGIKPRIFIPPYNEDNLNTTRAAGEEGIAVISSWEPVSADAEVTAGNADPESGIQRLPATASLSEYNATADSWMPNSHDQIMADIRGSIDAYGHAVVMMHPRDIELVDIRAIIADVKADGVQIASMADAANIPKDAAASHSSGGAGLSTTAEKPQSLDQFELGTIVIAVVGASVFAAIVIGRRRKRNQE